MIVKEQVFDSSKLCAGLLLELLMMYSIKCWKVFKVHLMFNKYHSLDYEMVAGKIRYNDQGCFMLFSGPTSWT
jgi:hypothetical protein